MVIHFMIIRIVLIVDYIAKTLQFLAVEFKGLKYKHFNLFA